MDDQFADVGGERVRVVRAGASIVLADIDDSEVIGVKGIASIASDAAGRMRVAQITTLGDYKVLNADRTLLLENVGTGSGSFGNNKYSMAVSVEYLYLQISLRPISCHGSQAALQGFKIHTCYVLLQSPVILISMQVLDTKNSKLGEIKDEYNCYYGICYKRFWFGYSPTFGWN